MNGSISGDQHGEPTMHTTPATPLHQSDLLCTKVTSSSVALKVYFRGMYNGVGAILDQIMCFICTTKNRGRLRVQVRNVMRSVTGECLQPGGGCCLAPSVSCGIGVKREWCVCAQSSNPAWVVFACHSVMVNKKYDSKILDS